MSKTVSLVLGSGGARGLAHVGVIHYLEENGFEIKSISGCSIGSAVGGFYCTGKLHLFENWITSLSDTDILNYLDVSWSKSGLFKGEKVINRMVELLGETKIEELPIPYTAVAADIQAEREVWINKGSLFDAIRASISLPLFFTPHELNGVKLIDGGVLNPVPIAPTLSDNTDLTIAVNLGGRIDNTIQSDDTEKTYRSGYKYLDDLIERFESFSSEKKKESWGMYDVADKAFDTMQSALGSIKIAASPPDVEIQIARNACGTLEFDRAQEMIDLGYSKAEQALKQYS